MRTKELRTGIEATDNACGLANRIGLRIKFLHFGMDSPLSRFVDFGHDGNTAFPLR